MTRLTLAVRNYLAQDEELTDMLGSDSVWDTWIFPDYPQATIENTSSVLIVVAPGSFDSMNRHNTEQFPNFYVDVWADSTRNPDNSMQVFDADDKIEDVWKMLIKNLHLVNPGATKYDRVFSGDPGDTRYWGTEEEIIMKTGVPIHTSVCVTQDISDVTDSEGTRMGRLEFSVSTV